MALANLLLSCSNDQKRGLYIPLVSHVATPNKLSDFTILPTQISAAKGTTLSYFCNALLLPMCFRDATGAVRKVAPSSRVTNAGFIVVTMEHDPATAEGLEESIEWTSNSGKLHLIDSELRRYHEYRGHCAVWSGHKSVHLHFVFDTKHLLNVPYQQFAADRVDAHIEHAAIMEGIYVSYYDATAAYCNEILCSSVRPDEVMRRSHQYRRTPWGMRTLTDTSDLLKLGAGTTVPQLVLCEKLRMSRSAKGSERFLVSPGVSRQPAFRNINSVKPIGAQRLEYSNNIVIELTKMCMSEWRQEFPKPTRMWWDQNEWAISFQNHAADNTPSSICRGDHDQILLQGRGAPHGRFFLPGELTANELGQSLAIRFGMLPIRQRTHIDLRIDNRQATGLARLKRNLGKTFRQQFEEQRRDSFPVLSTVDQEELRAIYRSKLQVTCADIRSFNVPAVVLSAEGIGKTRALFHIVAEEALETAIASTDGVLRLHAFAFRSEAQAYEKAAEYEVHTGRKAFVWRSFWRHYEDICARLGQRARAKADFHNESDVISILAEIKDRQPAVFDELEAKRRTFSISADAVLFTTHATVTSWLEGQVARTWHHPDFDPQMALDQARLLKTRLVLQDVVFDEPEPSELIWLLRSDVHSHLATVQGADWGSMTLKQRRDIFSSLCRSGAISERITFETYSELRYLDLGALQAVRVDYGGEPFGRENSATAIYRSWDQRTFHVGFKRWPFSATARITYLTTEALTTELVRAVYAKAGRPIYGMELDDLPQLYPIEVPLVKDKRARATDIQQMAKELLADSDRAVVIGDGLGRSDRTFNFQGMKGRNGLSGEDVFIIVTFLAPEVYAELNVIGQWAEISEIIAKYYAAQISQAVGRNTGFRQKPGTKTVAVMSAELFRQLRPKFGAMHNRFILQPTPEALWKGAELSDASRARSPEA